jgi:hypothetical protein
MRAAPVRTSVQETGDNVAFMRARVIGFTVLLPLVFPALLGAQTSGPRSSLAIGIGRTDPIPIDLPFIAPAWSVGFERVLATHVVCEAAATGWHHAGVSTASADDVDTRLVCGRVTLLGVAAIGRVRFSSGAGAGISRFSQTITRIPSCSDASQPACAPFAVSARSVLVSAQFVLGADVRLTPGLSAFVVSRLSQPFTEALGDFSLLTGVNIRLKK